MNVLRLNEGVPSDYFFSRTGLSIDVIEKPLNELIRQGLIEPSEHRLKTSVLGQRFLNTVLTKFIAPNL
jgi:oxygen-independent coproporphyrinogen-3 oxidase